MSDKMNLSDKCIRERGAMILLSMEEYYMKSFVPKRTTSINNCSEKNTI